MSKLIHDGNGSMENLDISRDKIISMLEVGAPWSSIANMLAGLGADVDIVAKIKTDLGSYSAKPGREPGTTANIKP